MRSQSLPEDDTCEQYDGYCTDRFLKTEVGH